MRSVTQARNETLQQWWNRAVGRVVIVGPTWPLWAQGERALADLIDEQEARLEAGVPVRAIPLAWVALAEMVGLTVDDTGRIIDGPKAQVPGL